jgi:hypothetical protein
MDWKECVRQNEHLGIRTRFEWPIGDGQSGFDCNTAFTFNDVWGGISWVWTWPGDYLLNSDAVRSFFELGQETIVGSWWSTALVWLPLILLISISDTQ